MLLSRSLTLKGLAMFRGFFLNLIRKPRMKIFLFCLAFLSLSQLRAETLFALDQPPVKGEITTFDNQKRLLIVPEGQDDSIGIKLDSIEEIQFDRVPSQPSPDLAPFRVVLLDGTVFFGAILESESYGSCTFLTPSFGRVEIDIFSILRIEKRASPQSEKDKIVSSEELERDQGDYKIYFESGSSPLCYLEEIKEERVKLFITGLDQDEGSWHSWESIRSIVRGPVLPDEVDTFSEVYALFTTITGGIVSGTLKAWKDQGLSIETRLCGELSVSTENLGTILFKNGRFLYLSDLTPEKVEEHSYFRSADETEEEQSDYLFGYQVDRAQGGGALRMQGKEYAKGLGVHAISRLTYELSGQYKSFSALIGIDDSAGPMASLVFELEVDGKPQALKIWESSLKASPVKKQEDSGIMKKGDAPFYIEADIMGAKSITLIVRAADNADVDDRANWVNVKVVR